MEDDKKPEDETTTCNESDPNDIQVARCEFEDGSEVEVSARDGLVTLHIFSFSGAAHTDFFISFVPDGARTVGEALIHAAAHADEQEEAQPEPPAPETAN